MWLLKYPVDLKDYMDYRRWQPSHRVPRTVLPGDSARRKPRHKSMGAALDSPLARSWLRGQAARRLLRSAIAVRAGEGAELLAPQGIGGPHPRANLPASSPAASPGLRLPLASGAGGALQSASRTYAELPKFSKPSWGRNCPRRERRWSPQTCAWWPNTCP
jgi:hypothetical protein